jgi:hypothetical protein
MRFRFVAAGFAVGFLVLIGAHRAAAAEVLDQQNDVALSATADSTSGSFQEQAQTFTVGVAGTLSRIAVQLNFPGLGLPGNAILTVYNTSGGVPNASLGTASLPSSGIPPGGYAYQSFDVSSYGIAVHVGDVLAYGVTSTTDSYFFLRSTSDHSTYAGGESQWRQRGPTEPWTSYTPTHDGGFQTYVIPSAAGLVGDYNDNGVVDAGDYVVWRRNDGTANTLPNDPIGGTVGAAQYDQWRTHFGQPAGSGAGANASAAVPEPRSAVIFFMRVVAMRCRRKLAHPQTYRLCSRFSSPPVRIRGAVG